MKYIKIIAGILVVFALFTIGISMYLSPDDIKGCGTMPNSKAGCEPADAIVALSGGDTGARADEAIKLYKAGWAKVIVFSGAAADKSGPSNALVMKQRAIDAGLDPNDVVVEDQSETTAQNAEETTSVFKQNNVRTAILVTSAYHMRRAGLEFDRRATGVDIRRHTVREDSGWNDWWWLTPGGWVTAMSEVTRSLIISTGGIDKR